MCGTSDARKQGQLTSAMGHRHTRFVNSTDTSDSEVDNVGSKVEIPTLEVKKQWKSAKKSLRGVTKGTKNAKPCSSIVFSSKDFLECYIGDNFSTTLDNNRVIFHHLSTVAIPAAVATQGQRLFYEVTFEGKVRQTGDSVSYVGWASTAFQRCGSPVNRCVGWCKWSWSYEGQHQMKYHDNGNTSWGRHFQPDSCCVLGVAADMVTGRLLYGLDGVWEPPMGVAFDDIDTSVGIFPAISAHNMKISINFGDMEFEFGPPDESTFSLNSVT